jgi:ABC-type lipoprotein release transport system permease subunit
MKNNKKRIIPRFVLWCRSSLKVGFFLAMRQLKNTSKWTTALIIFIMTLTFLNLVFVNGILLGLVAGSSDAYRKEYSGDLIIKNFESKDFIPQSNTIVKTLLSFEEVKAVTPRLLAGGIIEANYKERKSITDNPDKVSAVLVGIDPYEEDSVTGLGGLLLSGEYLDEDDEDEVLIGSNLLSNYSRDIPGDEALEKVDIGSRIRIVINGIRKEVTVKGVIKSKVGEVGRRVFMTDSFLRKLIGRVNFDSNEISVLLNKGIDPHVIKHVLQQQSFDQNGDIQTWEESQGQFFKDVENTFGLLGLITGSIGIVVASITVFIVIYINAITRKKFIGILKGIGICSNAINVSYIIQSFFYSTLGSIFGLGILYGFLKPYIDENPIDFPFSDGVLIAPVEGVMIRVSVLILITVIAGYIPAKIIVNKNTLDSILGR